MKIRRKELFTTTLFTFTFRRASKEMERQKRRRVNCGNPSTLPPRSDETHYCLKIELEKLQRIAVSCGHPLTFTPLSDETHCCFEKDLFR